MAKSGFGAAQVAVEQAEKNAKGAIEFKKFTIEKDAPAKRVRFLTLDGDDSVITYTEHWTEMNNGWKRNFACPNEELGEDNCIVCRGKKGVNYKADQRKNRHMIQLIDRTAGEVQVWQFSPMAMALLLEHLETYKNISDRDYEIQFLDNENGKADANIKAKFFYIIRPVGDVTPMSEADQQLAENRYKLHDLVPKYDEENLERIMQMLPGEGGKKDAAKPAAKAADFMAALGQANTGSNMATDLFKNITSASKAEATVPAEEKAVVSPVPVEETPAATQTTTAAPAAETSGDDFLKLLNEMK